MSTENQDRTPYTRNHRQISVAVEVFRAMADQKREKSWTRFFCELLNLPIPHDRRKIYA